ncbi:hypothetical protein OG500_36035 [Kitasatospora sp. NBC_01250]|uniref:hypothetical protein n=1 Tax=unclassified Kitasatospora TaxID=2633591 RepID=UPI002E0D6D6B|nr:MULTISPECIES: hypothetical protein [unclassified Kitasatospora]WSJ71352.1 hypothetical protein OG294_37545 [Kitasatospora sp. NBC_01302]
MRAGRPSRQQLRTNFHQEVENALAGAGLRSCTGLDDDTEQALWEIAAAEPADREGLAAAAYRAFAGQLDGSNAARWHADLQRRTAGAEPRPEE